MKKLDLRGIKRKMRGEGFWARLFRNAATALLGTSGAQAIGIITLSILVQSLGVTQYAFFVLGQQYMTVVDALVNFQSWQAIIKFGADAKAKKDDERLFADLKLGILMDVATAVAGTALGLLVLAFVCDLMGWGPEVRLAAYIFSLEIVFHIEGSSIGILRLFDKFQWTAINSIALAIFKLLMVGGYCLLPIQHTMIGYVVVYVATDIANHVSLFFMALFFLHRRFGLKRVLLAPLVRRDREFVPFCLWSNLGTTVDVPVKYLDVFIISAVSVEMVAVYKVFRQALQVFSLLTNPISTAIMPQMSELVSEGEQKRAFNVVLKIRNAICMVMVVCLVGAALLGYPLFSVLFGRVYAVNLPLFLLLLAIHFYGLMYVALHPYFYSLGLAKEVCFVSLVSNVVYLGVAFALVRYLGVYAIALATALQYLSTNLTKVRIVKKKLAELE